MQTFGITVSRVRVRSKGVVDLVKMKGVIWQNEDLGAKFEYVDIPSDLRKKQTNIEKN